MHDKDELLWNYTKTAHEMGGLSLRQVYRLANENEITRVRIGSRSFIVAVARDLSLRNNICTKASLNCGFGEIGYSRNTLCHNIFQNNLILRQYPQVKRRFALPVTGIMGWRCRSAWIGLKFAVTNI